MPSCYDIHDLHGTIKKRVVLLIVKQNFPKNGHKTGHLASFDQETWEFFDRNSLRTSCRNQDKANASSKKLSTIQNTEIQYLC